MCRPFFCRAFLQKSLRIAAAALLGSPVYQNIIVSSNYPVVYFLIVETFHFLSGVALLLCVGKIISKELAFMMLLQIQSLVYYSYILRFSSCPFVMSWQLLDLVFFPFLLQQSHHDFALKHYTEKLVLIDQWLLLFHITQTPETLLVLQMKVHDITNDMQLNVNLK